VVENREDEDPIKIKKQVAVACMNHKKDSDEGAINEQ